MIILKTRSTVSHKDPKMVHGISPSKDASIHRIWNSYLKEYRRYAPDSMQILEIRSEVKVSDPKMGLDTAPSQDAFTHQIWDSYLK